MLGEHQPPVLIGKGADAAGILPDVPEVRIIKP